MQTRLAMWITLALALFLQPVAADTVLMHNGDRLSGEVLRQEDGALLLRTDYAGTIRLDWAKVADVQLDDPVAVLLEDERVVSVSALTRDEDALRLQPAGAVQPMRVAPDQVRLLQPEPWELGQGGKFSGRVNLALEDESGNSESRELDLDATLAYRRRWSELQVFGQLEYDTTRGVESTNKWNLNNRYSRFFPDRPWYGAAHLRLKKDRFADVRLRTIAALGLGYGFGSGATRINVELGPTYVNEDYYSNPNGSYWGPGLFVDWEQGVLGERLEFYLHGMGFTSLSAENKDIWVSRTGLRVPLAGGFVGGIEYEIDHDNPPAVETRSTDETLRMLLGYEW
jgi:putative salt-induced outer membrane protein YdiY